MASRKYHLHDGKKGTALAIRVIPRAQTNEIAEVLPNGTVRIRLTAPPVDGQANQALAKFLSKMLGVPKSSIEIIAGLSSRDKLVSVLDMTPELVQEKILANLH